MVVDGGRAVAWLTGRPGEPMRLETAGGRDGQPLTDAQAFDLAMMLLERARGRLK